MRTQLTVIALALFAACEKPKSASPPETITTDGTAVTLTDEAPQWKYVEMSVAKKEPPLAPLPVPARVDLDEKRTSNMGVPLAGRVESVVVRPGTRVKAGDKLFSVRSGAFADLDRETEGPAPRWRCASGCSNAPASCTSSRPPPRRTCWPRRPSSRRRARLSRPRRPKQRSLQVLAAVGDNLFWVKAAQGGHGGRSRRVRRPGGDVRARQAADAPL